MHYAANPLPPLCISCGCELPETPDPGEGDGACPDCFGESQAKAAVQLAKERADQFQFESAEWFRTAKCERMPFNSRSTRAYLFARVA